MAATDTQPQSLRGRLKRATAQAHRALEAAMDIEAKCRDLDAYRGMVARLWGLYAPLEATLARVDWPGAETLVRQRAKAGWLASDLAFLGLTPGDLENLPRAADLPVVDTVADVLGASYVLEGATLGGQIILPRLGSELGLTDCAGGRFFASYGPEIGRHWRGFVDVLERFGQSPPTADRIEGAALQTFASFGRWMSDGATPMEVRERGR